MSAAAPEPPFRSWTAMPERVEADWPAATAAHALVAHLNFRGEAELRWKDGSTTPIAPRTILWLRAGPAELQMARRLASRDRHECLTLVFPDTWLRMTLQGVTSPPGEAFQPLIHGTNRSLLRQPLTEEDAGWARGAMPPHLCSQARQLLDSARLTEFFVHSIFRHDAGPEAGVAISRTQRIAQERVQRVKNLMLAQLDAPPSLDELAVAAGCNPSHLSRTFTQIEGRTLSQWLRRVRIEHAASLIASGKCNVSEAALEVGYQSFSHFSRAFAEEKGVPPSQWVRRLGGGK
ncbi:helix-turn-helix transcriptional regulator [Prosthecobacter sp.]|uniref:helix-turn-helix transcriptional regulator n=1 Tax=Prosthecobacter sp. TaxID=1965333 RepID=UPI0037835D99